MENSFLSEFGMRKAKFATQGLWLIPALMLLLSFSACGEKENVFSETGEGRLS